MRHESHQSRGATSFSDAHTSARRLQTQAEVAHWHWRSHAAARGVEAGDSGPVDLLRRHVARQPGEQLTYPEDDVFVVHAAVEAGQCLSAFVTRLGSHLHRPTPALPRALPLLVALVQAATLTNQWKLLMPSLVP